MNRANGRAAAMFLPAILLIAGMGCAQPLTKREQASLVGGGLGVATGAIIGSAVGHGAVGALIGAPIGLLAGALIGDQFMAQDQQINRNQAEIKRLRREIARLQRRNELLGER